MSANFWIATVNLTSYRYSIWAFGLWVILINLPSLIILDTKVGWCGNVPVLSVIKLLCSVLIISIFVSLQTMIILSYVTIVDKPTVSITTPSPAVEGQPVTIACRSLGSRPALTSVTWKKDQHVVRVTTETKYTGGTVQTSSLTIKNSTRTDAGQYKCQLSNDVGQNTGTVILQVWCKYLSLSMYFVRHNLLTHTEHVSHL